MVAQYADEAKRLRGEQRYLLLQQVLWSLSAIAAAGVTWVGFRTVTAGGLDAGMALVLLVVGVIGVAVSVTLAVAAFTEAAQWRKAHRD